jgi:MFS family permease
MLAGLRLVFGAEVLRTLVLYGWLVAFYEVPMGLAVPYASGVAGRLHPAAAAGLVFAAGPFGTMAGAIIFSRLVPPARRQAWLAPLAAAACAVLLVLALRPGLGVSLLVIAVSGACASYQLAANSAFVAAVPPERRGQAFGLANGGMQVAQGLWFVVAGGLAARVFAPGTVIAISGGIGTVLAAALAVARHRSRKV